MKKILVSKKTWACLCDIKKRLKFNGISKVVDYLVDSEQILLGENSHKTDDSFSIEKNSGFHEEKYVEKHPFDSELEESIESKIDRVLKGENGHKKADPVSAARSSDLLQELPEEKKEQPLLFKIQCVECGKKPFAIVSIRKDYWGLQCPHCRYTHHVRVFLEE